jgi:SMI1-KNR4 cell-wall
LHSDVLPAQEGRTYAAFRALIDPWAALGEDVYPDGTRWIGHISHCAPEAHLHGLYGPLRESQIEELQDQLERDFPASFRRFLRLHNGACVFTLFINVYGLRTSWTRTDLIAAAQQPFSMLTPNVEERPSGAPDDMLFIGSTGDGRNPIGMLPDGEVLQWIADSSMMPSRRYENVFEFLLTETRKAQQLFDEKGKRKDGSDILWKPS